MKGHAPTDAVNDEHMGEGTQAPVVMIRRGRWKFVYSAVEPPMLFDLVADQKKANLVPGLPVPPAPCQASQVKDLCGQGPNGLPTPDVTRSLRRRQTTLLLSRFHSVHRLHHVIRASSLPESCPTRRTQLCCWSISSRRSMRTGTWRRFGRMCCTNNTGAPLVYSALTKGKIGLGL